MPQIRDASGRFMSKGRIAELEAAGVDIKQLVAEQKAKADENRGKPRKTGETGLHMDVDAKIYFLDRIAPIIGKKLAHSLVRGVSKVRDHARRSIKNEKERRQKVRQSIEKRELEGKQATANQLKRLDRRTSSPGQPPLSHNSGSRSLQNILFGAIPETLTGIVGPVILRSGSVSNQEILGGKTVPQLLEEGGSALFTELRIGNRWTTIFDPAKKRNPKRLRKRHHRYAPRPFMRPALDKAIKMKQIAAQFEGIMPATMPYKELPK